MHRSVFLVVGGFVILIGLALLFAPASYFQLYAVAYAAEMNFRHSALRLPWWHWVSF